jgi:ribonuclease-3 family protein
MENIDLAQQNGLSLAYIGDAIYELEVRERLLKKGQTRVNDLQKMSRNYVSAKAHAALYQLMVDEDMLTTEEVRYFKRGRNANSHTKAKNTDVLTYRISTGVEALFGYLYITHQLTRINQLMDWIFKQVENGKTRS